MFNKRNASAPKGNGTIRNVNVAQCFYTIFFSAIAFLIFFIPFTFGNAGITTAFSHFNTDLFKTSEETIQGINSLFNNSDFSKTLVSILDIDALILFIILAFNIAGSLILILLRLPFLRRIFKLVSIIAGFLMIAIAISSVLHIAGIVSSILQNINANNTDAIMVVLENSGVLFVLATFILSIIMAKWQFRWFASLW